MIGVWEIEIQMGKLDPEKQEGVETTKWHMSKTLAKLVHQNFNF